MPLSEPVTTPADPRRGRRKEARPGELLDAALELFVERGFAATRVDDVALAAGVSKGTLFLYFPTKEALFQAVVRHNISGRFAEWDAEFAAFDGSTADMVRHCMQSWWERIGATRASGITKLLMGEARNFPELTAFYQHEVVRPGQALIRRVLERGVARGEFRIADLDYAVFAVVAPMVFLIMSRHSLGACAPADQPLDAARFIAVQAEIVTRGLAAEPAAPPAAARPGPARRPARAP